MSSGKKHRDPQVAGNTGGAPRPKSVWKSESQVLALADKEELEPDIVRLIGFEFKDDDDAKDLVRAIGKQLRDEGVRQLASSDLASFLAKNIKSDELLSRLKAWSKSPEKAMAVASTPSSPGSPSGRPSVTTNVVQLPEELQSTLRMDFNVDRCPLLELNVRIPEEYQCLLSDAFLKHAEKIEEKVRLVAKCSTDDPSSDPKRDAEILDVLRFEVKELLDQLESYVRKVGKLPMTENGRNLIRRECYRLQQHLPALLCREELETTLFKGVPKVVVTGATGSGKSTQLPQYVADCFLQESLETGCERRLVICTEPRRMAARALAERVRQEWNVDKEVGYDVGIDRDTDRKNRILFTTEFKFLRLLRLEYFTPEKVGAVIVDEAHERSVQCDIILGYMKLLVDTDPRWKSTKLIVTSATIDTTLFRKFLNRPPGTHGDNPEETIERIPLIEIPGRTYPVSIHYSGQDIDPEAENVDLAVAKVVEVLKSIRNKDVDEGDIMCFMPSAEEVAQAAEQLASQLTANTELHSQEGQPEFEAVELSGRLTSSEQAAVLKPSKNVRAIFCTLVAETSITISSVKYIVDVGLSRRPVYNLRRNLVEHVVLPISRQSADQRAGRAGRTSPGTCYRLYSEEQYKAMSASHTCELLSQPLEGACLSLIDLSLPVFGFPWVEPPPADVLKKAMQNLEALGAVDCSSGKPVLKKLGQFAQQIRLDIKLTACIFQVMVEAPRKVNAAVAMVAVLSVLPFWWFRPKDKEKQADEAHSNIAKTPAGAQGDVIGAVSIFASLMKLSAQQRKAHLAEHFVGRKAWEKASKTFDELVRSMKESAVVKALIPGGLKFPSDLVDLINDPDTHTLLRRALIHSFSNQLAIHMKYSYYVSLASGEGYRVHGSSLMQKGTSNNQQRREAKETKPDVILYYETFETRCIFMRGVTPIDLVELPGHLRNAAQKALDERPLYVEIPAPTLLLRRFWGTDFQAFGIHSIDPDAKAMNMFSENVLRVRTTQQHKSRIEAKAKEIITKETQGVYAPPVEHAMSGCCRVLLGDGGRVCEVLAGQDQYVTVRVSNFSFVGTSARQSICDIVHRLPHARQYIGLEIGRQAHSSTVTFWLQFASLEHAHQAYEELLQNGLSAFPSYRAVPASVTQSTIRTEFSISVNLTEVDPDDPKHRVAISRELVGGVRRCIRALFPSTADVRDSYNNRSGVLSVMASTDPETASKLRLATQQSEVIEGFSKMKWDYQYSICIPIPEEVVIRQLLQRALHGCPRSLGYSMWISYRTLVLRSRDRLVLDDYASKLGAIAEGTDISWPRNGLKGDIMASDRGLEFLRFAPDSDALGGKTPRPVSVDQARRVLRYHGGTPEEAKAFEAELSAFVKNFEDRGVKSAALVQRRKAKLTTKEVKVALKKISKQFSDDLLSPLNFVARRMHVIATSRVFDEIAKLGSLIDPTQLEDEDEEQDPDGAECPVCMTVPQDPYMLRCGHVACRACYTSQFDVAQPVLPVKCMSCADMVSMQDVKNIAPAALARIAEMEVRQRLEGDADFPFTECYVKRCQGLVPRLRESSELPSQSSAVNVHCSACKSDYCLRCAAEHNVIRPSHRGECTSPMAVNITSLQKDLQELLYTRCPRCKVVIDDFDGCFAVTCSKCQCGFCGFCMEDCGDDAHTHAASCNRNETRGRVFASLDVYHKLRDQDKVQRLREYFEEKQLPPAVQAQLKRWANTYLDYFKFSQEECGGASAGLPASTPHEEELLVDRVEKLDLADVNNDAIDKDLQRRIDNLVIEMQKLDTGVAFHILSDTDAAALPPLSEVCQRGSAFQKLLSGASSYASCAHAGDRRLSGDEITAIRMYTGNGIYMQLNETLRALESRNSAYEALVPYMHYLLSGLKKIPSAAPVFVYRGLKLTEEQGEKYQEGRRVSWRGLTSCSTNPGVAAGFSSNYILKIKLFVSGCSVQQYSLFPRESEVLLWPRVPLLVTKRVMNNQGSFHVELEEIIQK